jgi:hypothetical protein
MHLIKKRQKMFIFLLHLTKYGKIIISLLILFVSVFLIRCDDKRQHHQWETATVDSMIATNDAFKQLNKEMEVFSALENQDSSAKRSSGVLYFTKGHVNLSDSNSAKLNNCRAFFFHSDTLYINIGIGNGFGGWGFIINYKNNKFYTEPYYSNDVIIEGEPEPVYEIIYQKVTLDKFNYKIGDSLFGKIDFKAIEIGPGNTKFKHKGNGYFRTKVKTL